MVKETIMNKKIEVHRDEFIHIRWKTIGVVGFGIFIISLVIASLITWWQIGEETFKLNGYGLIYKCAILGWFALLPLIIISFVVLMVALAILMPKPYNSSTW